MLWLTLAISQSGRKRRRALQLPHLPRHQLHVLFREPERFDLQQQQHLPVERKALQVEVRGQLAFEALLVGHRSVIVHAQHRVRHFAWPVLIGDLDVRVPDLIERDHHRVDVRGRRFREPRVVPLQRQVGGDRVGQGGLVDLLKIDQVGPDRHRHRPRPGRQRLQRRRRGVCGGGCNTETEDHKKNTTRMADHGRDYSGPDRAVLTATALVDEAFTRIVCGVQMPCTRSFGRETARQVAGQSDYHALRRVPPPGCTHLFTDTSDTTSTAETTACLHTPQDCSLGGQSCWR